MFYTMYNGHRVLDSYHSTMLYLFGSSSGPRAITYGPGGNLSRRTVQRWPLAMDDRSAGKTTTMLNVEDDEARQNRLKSLLENLNSPLTSQPARFTKAMPQFDFGERKTFQVQPPSELLSRVQAFLPRLEASNVLIAQQVKEDPSSVDIEHISPGMDRYIEMNLGLGLFEDRSKRKGTPDEDSEMSNSSLSSSDASDSSEMIADADDYNDSDEESDPEIITSFVPIRRIKPLPRRATNPRPNIVVVSGGDRA